MKYSKWLDEVLTSPETQKPLICKGDFYESQGKIYHVKNDVLSVVYPEELSGQDAKFNKIYNLFAPLYDLNERIFGKLLFGIDMAEGRNQIISFLGLKPGMSVLEVSPGPGVFQKAIREKIGIDSQYVSLDLSMGMLSQCQKRNKNLNIQLVHGNAQYLPFADNSFDALFHFGGVNLFNDPQKAISEFVRVVKKGGIVSWGDEGISESYSDKRRKKIALKMNPGFSKPKPAVPETVIDVVENEVYGGLAYLVVAKKRM